MGHYKKFLNKGQKEEEEEEEEGWEGKEEEEELSESKASLPVVIPRPPPPWPGLKAVHRPFSAGLLWVLVRTTLVVPYSASVSGWSPAVFSLSSYAW